MLAVRDVASGHDGDELGLELMVLKVLLVLM